MTWWLAAAAVYLAAGVAAWVLLRAAARALPVPRFLDAVLSGLPGSWVSAGVVTWPAWLTAIVGVAADETLGTPRPTAAISLYVLAVVLVCGGAGALQLGGPAFLPLLAIVIGFPMGVGALTAIGDDAAMHSNPKRH